MMRITGATNNMSISQMMTRYFNASTAATQKSMKVLSSGYKINSAKDDAAGMAIYQKMRSQTSGISAASNNVQDTMSMIRTADGVMGGLHSMTNRMKELATKASNGLLGAEERQSLQSEYNQLLKEVDRSTKSATFNGNKLFDGSTYTMQVGDKSSDTMDLEMKETNSNTLGLDTVDLTTADGARAGLDVINSAINQISSQRGEIGAAENGLEYTFNSLTNYESNITEAMSRIMDADIGKASINQSLSTIMNKTSLAMMKNAQNMLSYNAMQLLLK